jgi:hypothetical protein
MSRRLRIIVSGYGRDHGWFVEVAGETVAVLTDCRWEDMFWDSYLVEPATPDTGLVLTEGFWNRIDVYQPVYRSREFGEVAPHAFSARRDPGTGVSLTGRVVMRGLYLDVPSYPWDGLLLWYRRLSRKVRS